MKKFVKWLAIGFGSLLLLLVAAAIIVPMVVDVDKYRPQIVQAANERINGKLELGKLKLSLWGQVRVQIQGLQLLDPSGRKVLGVNDAYFRLPFLSILSGSPQAIFHAERPELLVVKNKAGKLNVMSIMKKQPAEEKTPQAGQPTQPSGAPAEPVKLPGLAARARLGVELLDALVTYKDEATGLDTQVKDFNLVMKDLSLTRTTDIELWADLDTKMGKTFSLRGPARLKAKVKPELKGGAFERATIDANLDLDDLEMASGTAFHKKKGVPLHADLVASASTKEAVLEKLVAKFHNAELKASGTVSNLGAEPATPGATPPAPVVKGFTLVSNDIDFKSWNELVPMLKEYELGGVAKLSAEANGPTDKLAYKAKLAINALTAKAPKLKAQPRFDAVVDVVTDQIQNMQLTMKAPGNEMTFKGKLVSFTKPQGAFELTSPGMDLDQLIEWPPAPPKTAQTEAAAPQGGQPKGGKGTGAPAEDYDATLDALRSNPVAANATLVMPVSIKMLKAKGIRMTDMVGKLYLRDLTAGLEGFAVRLWEGSIKANFASQLKPKAPTYTFSTVASGLELKQAVADNVQMFKNTLVGRAHFDLSGSGASFNPEPAKSNLKAKGSMKVENAAFATIDVARMASEAINKAIDRVAEKVPQVKDKKVGLPGGTGSKYEVISSDFSIADAKFTAPNFLAKAAPNQGIDLKGSTQVGIKDYSLNAAWQVIDTYNLLKARDISVNVGGTQVDHLLAEGNGPVKFTVHVACNCFQPCYSYTEVPEQLAKVALGNVTGAASARAQSELKKRAESMIPKGAPPAVNKAIEGLGKKLFR